LVTTLYFRFTLFQYDTIDVKNYLNQNKLYVNYIEVT